MNLFEGRLGSYITEKDVTDLMETIFTNFDKCGGCGQLINLGGKYCNSCTIYFRELNRQAQQDSDQYYRDNPTPRNTQ